MLKLIDICLRYKDKIILSNFSFEIFSNNIYCICGVNGTGKTSLIKLFIGVMSPKSGKILYCEKELSKLSISEKRKIGFYIGEDYLFDDLNVLEYLYLIGSIYNLSKKSIDLGIIDKSQFFFDDINQIKMLYLSQLSTGQKKKVGLLASILHNPELIIWDEPFENLDMDGIKSIRNFMDYSKHLGHTVIFSTPKDEFRSDFQTIDLNRI